MVRPLMVFVLALAGCIGLSLAISRRRNLPRSNVLLWTVAGFIGAGALVWFAAVPAEWTLSFPQTLAASVDSETWGHPIEHYAESLLVVMLAACTVSAAAFGAMTAFGGRLFRSSSPARS